MALKILMLTPRIPFPLRDGGSIAMNQTMESYLEQGCEVSVLAMNTSRHWVEESTLPAYYQQLKHFITVYVKTNVNPLSAFINLFTEKSYNVARFENKDFENELLSILQIEQFDIIQFESIYTSPYLHLCKKNSQAKLFCRVHNIEHLIWQRLTENETSFLKKKYLTLLTARLKAYELDILQKFDLLLPISKTEDTFLQSMYINQTYYLPFGENEKINLPSVETEWNSIYHVGSMDWAPNVEGVQWFLDTVWQEIASTLPDVHLYLAGKNMSASILSMANNRLHVVGEIEDVVSFSLSKNIMIVPLLSGAGIRIKIVEAMAIGKVIITTTVGAEGIGAEHMNTILIAKNAEEFLQCILFCFREKEKAIQIGKRAKAFILDHYQRHAIYREAIAFYQQMM